MRALTSAAHLLGQAADGISGWRWRSCATALAVAFATAAAVAVPAVTRSNEGAVAATFAATRGDFVTFTPPTGHEVVAVLPSDLARLAARPEVRSTIGLFPVTGVDARTLLSDPSVAAKVFAVAGDLTAAAFDHVIGAQWTPQMAAAGTPVAIVGAGAAKTLGVGVPDGREAVLLDGLPYLVLGIAIPGDALAMLSDAVLIPEPVADQEFPTQTEPLQVALVRSDPANLATVAVIGQRTLAPEQPGLVTADYSTGAEQLGDIVTAQMGSATLAVTAIGAVVAGVLVVALMSGGVTARKSEIGLKRALGAHPYQVTGQFLIEGSVLGAIGAGLGCLLGAGIAMVAAHMERESLLIPPNLFPVVFWAVTGASMLACFPPAWRAGRVDPVDALTAQ